jgi:hypothetical protein
MDNGPVIGEGANDSGARLHSHLNLALRVRMSGNVPLCAIYALLTWKGTTTFAWVIKLIKGTECETDEINMERKSANVRCCLACTEYVKMKGGGERVHKEGKGEENMEEKEEGEGKYVKKEKERNEEGEE